MDRHVIGEICDRRLDIGDLSSESLQEPRAVAPVDPERGATEQGRDDLDLPCVALAVDHVHAGRSDCDVVDVSEAHRRTSIVEHRNIRASPGERAREDLLSPGTARIVSLFLPKAFFVLGRDEAGKQTCETGSRRTELLALLPQAFSLAPRARASSSDVERRYVTHLSRYRLIDAWPNA